MVIAMVVVPMVTMFTIWLGDGGDEEVDGLGYGHVVMIPMTDRRMIAILSQTCRAINMTMNRSNTNFNVTIAICSALSYRKFRHSSR